MTRMRITNRLPGIVCALVAIAALMVAPSPGQQPSPASAVLRWLNGDELPGELVGATSSGLTWRTPVLSKQISIELDYLESVRAAAPSDPKEPAGPFRFDLTGGDVVFGSLAGIDGDRVLVRSPRHGELSIKRAWVTGIARTDGAELRDLTRAAGRGWKSVDRNRMLTGSVSTEWNMGVSGQASTTTLGARLFLPGDLPNVCDIELIVESKTMPRFMLAYGSLAEVTDRKGAFEIDAWADELVVQSSARADDFERLITLTPTMKAVQLRVIWDRETGKLSVYGAAAKLLAEVPCERRADRPNTGVTGLLLENKSSDLTVKVLRVSPWESGQKLQPTASHDVVRTVGGRELQGKVTRMEDDGLVKIAADDGTESTIELSQLAQMSLRVEAAGQPLAVNCALTLHDGTQLRGQLTSVGDGKASLKTPFSEAEVAIALDGLRELKFSHTVGRKTQDTSHVLRLGERQLHGTLASAGDALGWRPVGSSDVIPLNTKGTLNIKRSAAAKRADATSRFRDVLYLQNGDQAPCTVTSIDENGVHFTTDFSDVGRISPSELKAIEFNSGAVGVIADFMDPRWQISPQQANMIERTETQVALRGTATLNHPDIMKQGGLEFDLSWDPNVQVTLDTYLFTAANARQRLGPRFHINLSGNQLQIHSITNDGNVQSYMVQAKNAEKDKPKASFCFSSERGEMKLLVDGTLVCSVPMLEKTPTGTGISINCQANQMVQQVVENQVNAQGQVIRRVRRIANPVPANAGPILTISNLRASQVSGLLRGMRLGEKDRTQFLTVPRMRRHNPPQHALIAKNGDLVRGELLALGPQLAQFRVGLEDVAIPRERLSGIVWLELEDKAEAVPADAGAMQAVFRNGSILRVNIDQVEDGKAVGKHPVFGTCRLALDEINELRTGKPSPATQVVAYSGWTLINAKEPVIPGADGSGSAFGTYSPLVGKQAEDFALELLNGKKFQLSEHKNKVVVLDFWATWCVPCVQAFPQLIGATSKYPDDVVFIAVNQQENAATIRDFLKAHEWTAEVALDRDGNIGRMYQVDGIPQTVVIGRGGKIEKVGLGVSPNLEAELSTTLAELVAAKVVTEATTTDATAAKAATEAKNEKEPVEAVEATANPFGIR